MDAKELEQVQGPGVQARAWLVRIKSGAATVDDLAAFGAWRRSDASHEAAYRETLAHWQRLGPAFARAPEPAAPVPPPAVAAPPLSRRRLLGGAGLMVAAAIALPFALGVQTLPAGATVLETRKGERRRAVLPDGVTVELNTDTRLVSWRDEGMHRVALSRGEALVSVDYRDGQRLRASAGNTEIFADRARFLMSLIDGAAPRVLCVWGDVEVHAAGRTTRLGADEALDPATGAVRREPRRAIAGALEWRSGVFVFKGRRARDVVDELNRYREGHVYLPASHADVLISGVIHLDRADAAIDHVADSLGMKATHLPGGVVILRP